MTDEQFDQFVTRIQQRYGTRPFWLRLRVLGLVVLGYAGFLAGLLLVLLVSAALVFAAIAAGTAPGIFLMAIVAIILALGIWHTLFFLWVPLESTKGREVTAEEVPILFHLLQELQDDFETAPFHRVQITPDFNAGVQMVPRWGVFGFNRTILAIGLPLMQSVSPEQFAAVLAHEFAHTSSRHDRFGMWIYRLRLTWSRVFTEIQTAGHNSAMKRLRGPVMWFVNWFWPRFNAYAFVLSRANEYQADQLSAEWGGVETTAEALWRIECFGRRLNDDFWNELVQIARSQEAVPDDVMARMKAFFEEPPKPDDAARWVEQSIRCLTGTADTHPSLSDRVEAIGYRVVDFARAGFPQPGSPTAEVLLGTARERIEHDVNAQWQDENRLKWQNVFHHARRVEKQRVSQEATDSTTLSVEQLWEQARSIGQLQGTAAAEPLLRQLLQKQPLHGPAALILGSHLLERGNREGEQFLRALLQDGEHEMIPNACEVLSAHFQQNGQSESAREMKAILSRYQTTQAAASVERSTVTVKDTFIPHGLTASELSTLRTAFSSQPKLASAWLVRKDLQHFQKQKLFVLVVRTEPTGLFGGSNEASDLALVKALTFSVKLPGRVLVIAPQGGFRALAKKIMKLDDTMVFP
jgi:Zn-dependent protease with chaperone function